MSDFDNLQQLKKLDLPISNRDLLKFYVDNLERQLPRKTILRCQKGGSNLYRTRLNDTLYEVAVDIIEGFAPFPEEEPDIFYPTKIYFFHPKETMKQSCVIIWIHENSKLGELRDVGSEYDCFRRIGATDYPVLPRKKGETILNLVLKYCEENYREMGIFGLTLEDNSYYRCGLGQKVSLQLPIVRQLLGQKPFYMKFGFQPENPNTKDVIYRNLKKAGQIKVSDKIFMGSSFLDWLSSTERVELDISPESLLSVVLSAILNEDCNLFSRIYLKVARYVGLEHVDNAYLLIFRKRSFSV